MAPKKFVSSKNFNNSITIVYTVMVILWLIAMVIAIPALILAAISYHNTTNLSNTKQDSAPFNTWNAINCTLFKNDMTNNVVLLTNVPILWTQVGKLVWMRLPFLSLTDTLTGPLSYFTLFIAPANPIPFMQGDSYPWGGSSSISLHTTIFNVNSNVDNRVGEIIGVELGVTGQAIIYDFTSSQNGAGVAADASTFIRGETVTYETNLLTEASAVDINSYTFVQIMQSVFQGGYLPGSK